MTQRDLTIAAVRRAAADRLKAAGVRDPMREAARLVAEVAGPNRGAQTGHSEQPLSCGQAERLKDLLARRERREPLSRILGERGFWTLDLQINEHVLDPRPETEHVVEALLAADAPGDARVLDLGVGSGAILLSVLSERPGAFGVGVDVSQDAIAVVQANADRIGLADRMALVVGDWNAPVGFGFDLIACNPPYIRSGDIARLEPEVRDHEPRVALDGGADGLDAYKRFAAGLGEVLKPGGTAAFEIGAGQSADVCALLSERVGWTIDVIKDLAGHDRVVRLVRPPG